MIVQITYTELVKRQQVIDVEMTNEEYNEWLTMSEFDKEQKYNLCASTDDNHFVQLIAKPIQTKII